MQASSNNASNPGRRKHDYVGPILIILVVLASLAAAVLAFKSGAKGLFSDDKAYETALQFLLVVVLGGGVAWAYRYVENQHAEWLKQQENERLAREKESDREREHKAAILAGLRELRTDVIAVYHKGKKIRRTLRAKSFHASNAEIYSTTRHHFETLMNEMEDVQLKLEALKEEMGLRDDLFEDAQQKRILADRIGKAEKYLRNLLRYYENNYDEWRKVYPDDEIPLDINLSNFVGTEAPNQRVKNEFYQPMSDAREIIINRLKAMTK